MKEVERKIEGLTTRAGIVAVAALLSSCSSKPGDVVVGKWKEVGGTETMGFFRDGTVSIPDKEMSMGRGCKFIEKDRVKIELGGLGVLIGPQVARVSISGEELTVTMPDGKMCKYQRSR